MPVTVLFLLAVTLAPPTHPLLLRGVVFDASQRPVEGAVATTALDDTRIGVSASTDGDGAFELALDAVPARLRIAVEHPSHGLAVIEIVNPESGEIALGAVTLLPTIAVGGRVLSADGAPITDAEVFADDPRTGRTRSIARTDAAGRYAYDQAIAAPVRYAVRATGHVSLTRTLDPRDPSQHDITWRLKPSPPLTGRVIDAEGQPVPDATATLLAAGHALAYLPEPSRTDADGRFSIDDQPSIATSLRVTAVGHAPLEVPRRGNEPVGDLVLGDTQTIVIDCSAATGAWREVGYEVYTQHDGGWRQAAGTTTLDPLTDAELRCAVPRGDVARLTLRGDGLPPLRLPDLTLRDVEVVRAVAPRIERGVIVGTVVGVTSAPVPAARVELTAGERTERAVRADDRGAFRFDDVPAGAWRVSVREDGLFSEDAGVIVRDGETSEVTLNARAAPTLRGRVTIGGAPPPAPMRLSAYRIWGPRGRTEYRRIGTTVTAHDGSYRFDSLTPGPVLIQPRPLPDAMRGAVDVELPPRDALEVGAAPFGVRLFPGQETLRDIDLQPTERRFCYGTVTVNGVPREQVHVSVRTDNRIHAEAFTDVDGGFRFLVEREIQDASDGTQPAVELDLRVGSLSASHSLGDPLPIHLDIPAGAVVGQVRGLERRDGQPPRASLEVPSIPTDMDPRRWRMVTQAAIDEDGGFRFDEVNVGTTRVAVEDPTGAIAYVASTPFEVEPAGRVRAILNAAPACELQARLVLESDEDTPPFALVWVDAAEDAPPIAKTFVGWFVDRECFVRGLPPTEARVHLIVYGHWEGGPDQTVTIEPGKAAQVEFSVRRKEG